MSGSNLSGPNSGAVREAVVPLSLTVHSMSSPAGPVEGTTPTLRRSGRLKMLLVLLVCAAPVIASYFTYFVIRPQGRTNYSELIEPIRPMPDLPLTDLAGKLVNATSLKGQWLLVVVASGACDAGCDKLLWLQRQLRETLGREKDRLDKVWLINDQAALRPETLNVIQTGVPVTTLRVPADRLASWLQPATGRTLEQHLMLVDPMGNWMMRVPPDPDPARLKRDLDKLLRASSSWDEPGR